MTFDDLLQQVIALLKRQGRVSYGAIKRRFELADDYLEDIKNNPRIPTRNGLTECLHSSMSAYFTPLSVSCQKHWRYTNGAAALLASQAL